MLSVLKDKCTGCRRKDDDVKSTLSRPYSTEIVFILEMLYNYFFKKLKFKKIKVYIRNH
jgi:hypothetical protein